MINGKQVMSDGITYFTTEFKHGQWYAVSKRNGKTIKTKKAESVYDAFEKRGELINEFWNFALN